MKNVIVKLNPNLTVQTVTFPSLAKVSGVIRCPDGKTGVVGVAAGTGLSTTCVFRQIKPGVDYNPEGMGGNLGMLPNGVEVFGSCFGGRG